LIHIGINPNLGSIGSLAIGWHGILMTVGILAGVCLTWFLAKKLGIPTEVTIVAAIWGVVCGIIGSRISWALDPENLSAWRHPVELLAIQNGGMGWYGGLIGGALGIFIYNRINRFPLGRFVDAATPGVILGLSIGRVG